MSNASNTNNKASQAILETADTSKRFVINHLDSTCLHMLSTVLTALWKGIQPSEKYKHREQGTTLTNTSLAG